MARATAVVAPNLKDPSDSAFTLGKVRVTVDDLSGSSMKTIFTNRLIRRPANAPKVDPTPNKRIQPLLAQQPQAAVATVATATTAAAFVSRLQHLPQRLLAMLAETETFYNQQIKKAVSSGDIEKAMTLTSEAERASQERQADLG